MFIPIAPKILSGKYRLGKHWIIKLRNAVKYIWQTYQKKKVILNNVRWKGLGQSMQNFDMGAGKQGVIRGGEWN